ncbi:SRPBCC family protein [Streptomyces sp. V3I7]|uniref:SRPBCC family protein n=1 Tax=Streptomyces sp. V3I7 TaxID=3042278 RepID=UPI00277E7CFA|nr:SRPBCC family protein [Streptomyces sp. V3I7]MDQ0994533.1 carbon monoxide dehydrogenase subunit G [Streptomyces sp. V3I7]
MELHHEFTVPVPVEDAWRALLDIERVVRCLPGATVEEYDGETVTASVEVEVGPITVNYRGAAVFQEQDDSAHRMVLVAGARETRGQDTARATVTSTLTERDGATAVSVHTDLTVTSRPARFGRGDMSEAGDRLVGRFADCLARQLSERPAEPAAPPAPSPAPSAEAPAPTDEALGPIGAEEPQPFAWEEPDAFAGEEPQPVDLLRAAAVPLAKRAAGVAAALAVPAVVFWFVRRLRRPRARRAPWRR